jgi:hypothetical protein
MPDRGLKLLPLLRSVSVSMKAVHEDRLEGQAALLTTETMSTGGREVFLLKKNNENIQKSLKMLFRYTVVGIPWGGGEIILRRYLGL